MQRRMAGFLLCALVACGGMALDRPPDSGVDGIVLVGPQCPVEVVGSPCPDRPLAVGIRVTEAASGRAVATARSGSDGRFRIPLAPGSYLLAPQLGAAVFPTGGPFPVSVRPHAFTTVTLPLDSGIR